MNGTDEIAAERVREAIDRLRSREDQSESTYFDAESDWRSLVTSPTEDWASCVEDDDEIWRSADEGAPLPEDEPTPPPVPPPPKIQISREILTDCQPYREPPQATGQHRQENQPPMHLVHASNNSGSSFLPPHSNSAVPFPTFNARKLRSNGDVSPFASSPSFKVDADSRGDSSNSYFDSTTMRESSVRRFTDGAESTTLARDSSIAVSKSSKVLPESGRLLRTFHESSELKLSKETKESTCLTFQRDLSPSPVLFQPSKRLSPPPLHVPFIFKRNVPITQEIETKTDPLLSQMKESKEWLELKFQEITPNMTDIGHTLEESVQLLQQHQQVLQKLQTKQSPVEELLRQADDLIGRQQPRAEVYTAMAGNLGTAWSDLNTQLELRRKILELAVAFHTKAREFSEKMDSAQNLFCDIHIPSDVDKCKALLQRHLDEKKGLLEWSMQTLTAGQKLLEKVREVAGDSRGLPPSVDECCNYIECLIETLHDRRRHLESLWAQRKAALEKGLQRCLLLHDIQQVSHWLKTKGKQYARSNALGESAASTEILLHEHLKMGQETKEIQERGIRNLSNAEQFAATSGKEDEVKTEAYEALAEATDLVALLDSHEHSLREALEFFTLAQSALTKLDQLEVTIGSTEPPKTQQDLDHFQANISRTIDQITEPALTKGYVLINKVGKMEPSAQGLVRKVAELEQRHNYLLTLCPRVPKPEPPSPSLLNFLKKYDMMCQWLERVPENYLLSHPNMGETFASAKDFHDGHARLQSDIQMKRPEVEALLSLAAGMPEEEVIQKSDALRDRWSHLSGDLETRLKLAQRYSSFHRMANQVNREMDAIENSLHTEDKNVERSGKQLDEQWLSCQQQLLQLDTSARNFKDDARKDHSSLDIGQAVSTVDSLMEKILNRNNSLASLWNDWKQNIERNQEQQLTWDKTTRDSYQISKAVSKLEKELFPILPRESGKHAEPLILYLENHCPSEADKIQQMMKDTEIQREKVNNLKLSSDLEGQKKKALEELNCLLNKLDTWQKGYNPLVAALLSYFRNVHQLEQVVERQEADFRAQSSLLGSSTAAHTQQLLTSHEAARSPILELISCATSEADQVALQVAQVEPKEPANEDRSKIYQIIEDLKCRYQDAWDRHRASLTQHLQMANFNQDLHQINQQVEELSNQLSSLKGHYGESLTSAKETSQSLSTFEKTIEALEKRIVQFVSTAEKLMNDHSGAVTLDPHHIQGELQNLQTKWSTFHRQMGDYQTLVELSLEYFRLIEEVEEWYKEGSSALATIARRSAAVKTPQDASSLLKEVEQLAKPDDNKQEERLHKISQLAIQLYGGQQPPAAVQKLASQSRELSNSLSAINSQLKSQSFHPDQGQEKTFQAVLAGPQEAIPFSFTKDTISPPEFVQPLKDIEVTEGGRCTFTCQVTGHPIPQICWYKEGIPVNPDYKCSHDSKTGQCTLTIEETFTDDSGRFTCQAINSGGQAETQCHLTVKDGRWLQREEEAAPVAPHFLQCVEAKGPVIAGQLVTLECQVKGWPVPDVTWHHDDVPLESVPGIEIIHDKSLGTCWLSIPKFRIDLQGVYTCRATNIAGQASSSATIIAHHEALLSQAPSFTLPLSNAMARAGQKLRLEARVSDPSAQLTWLHNNRPLTDAPQHVKTSFDGELASLIIPEAFPKDAGLYTLVARNDAGQNSCSCSVLVKGRLPLETSDSELASDQEPIKPQVREPLSDCTVLEGNPVRLDCVIVGQPEPEVIWYHNDKPIKESNDISLLFEGDRCSLLIKEAYLEDAGTFKCVAINSGGEASSKCQLTVESLTEASDMEKSTTLSETCPKFGHMSQDVQAVEGNKVVLQCEVSGQPRPTVIWLKEGRQIEPSSQYQMEFSPENGGIAKLTIHKVKPSDAGTYMVLASNSVGEARSYRSLMVTPPAAQSRPLFSQYLDNMRVKQGQKVVLTCRVSGTPLPHISWQFNGRPLVEDVAAGVTIHQISQTGEQSVIINQASAAHIGQYTIIAENATGKAVSTAFLNVEAPVNIYMKDDNIIEQRRLESTKLCRKTMVKQTVSGITDSLELHEVSAHEERGYSKTAGEEPKEYFTSDRQERHEVEGGDKQQQQKSIVTNDVAGAMQVSPPLNQPPKFSRLLVGTSVPFGQPFILEGMVEGFPLPSIKWTKDDGKGHTVDIVASPSKVQMSYEGRRVRLEVLKATKADAGIYSCTVSNIMGQVSSSAQVHVLDTKEALTAPKFERELSSLSVRSGDRVEMCVEVSGWPVPQVNWYRDGKIVEDCPDFRLGSPSSGRHTLTIPEVFPEDAGMYRAVATNPAGETATAATLIVTESDSTDSGDNYTTYRHTSRLKEERKMYTKISMTCSPSPEPILLEDGRISSCPPKPVAAVESRIWSPTRKEPQPAPHIIPVVREDEHKPPPSHYVPLKSVPKSPEYIYVSTQQQSKPPPTQEPIRVPTTFISKPLQPRPLTPSREELLNFAPFWSPSKSGGHALFSQTLTWKPVQAPSPSFRSDSPLTPPPKKTFVSTTDKENVFYHVSPKPFSRVDIPSSPKPMDIEYCPSPPPVTMTKPPPPPPAFLKRQIAEPVAPFNPKTVIAPPAPNFPQVGRVKYLTAKFNQNLPATDL